ncbi:efflux RND transporter periplasmic adaptor subunit [Thalassotalea sp. 1_MG-2023]|uniref:efflux RND transporter periplasmic adaptor subunit n=1 Tax=Thalassotalea sp. 1_MG-2023 TaxID=3062680 RepID=UPI0026E3B341|nr:efflux RND transporter periplasmic adaptor subunit [Thalassotalea sp. 1_MG-2023]MDO6428686.1 efflux RND transporter periplasmic adaptor subunit [Thalassotalea sp. 1_MG-2023]
MRNIFYCFFLLFLVACSDNSPKKEPLIRPIAWQKVSLSPMEQVRTLSGIIAPVETATLSFEVAGKLEDVPVNLGDTVQKGQRLAQLNQRSFSLSVQSANANLQQIQANFSEAKSTYNRFKQLIKQELVSQSDFDNAKAAFESTKSAVAVAQAQVDIANKNQQDSILLAPYDGVITNRLIEPSQQVTPGQPIFEIEGEHGLEVHVMVPETLIRELTKNTELNVTFPVLNQVVMKGHITEIGTRAQSANAFPLTVMLNDNHDALRAGMTAEVSFTYKNSEQSGYSGPAIRIPATAIGADLEQKSYVFVYNKTSKTLNKRYVHAENVINNEIILSKGLKNGEIIATAGIAFLRDGQQVTLLDQQTQRFN